MDNSDQAVAEHKDSDGGPPIRTPQPPHERLLVRINWALSLLLAAYVIGQFCHYFWDFEWWFEPSVSCTYAALSLLIASILFDQRLRYDYCELQERLEDPYKVKAKIIEARTYASDDVGYDKRKTRGRDLHKEADRLEQLGEERWTEYQVLNLKQMLVLFWERADLIESARSYLADLEDYAQDYKFRYEWEQLTRWKTRIEERVQQLESDKDKEEKDDPKLCRFAEMLRAQVSSLIEHVTDYTYYWSVGSTKIRALTISGILATALLVVMGILPWIHINGCQCLEIYNWGILGIAGALTSVLLKLRQSDAVEVGNTEGKMEIRNAMLGAVLGLVAGILLYAAFLGGLLKGAIFPEYVYCSGALGEFPQMDIGKSIFWAIAAGYSFEVIFDQLRKKTKNIQL